MTNHRRMLPLLVIFICCVVMAPFAQSQTKPPRPNVVWILSEDNPADDLRHFGIGGATTPNIEALAAHGGTFDHAFSNSPVCSIARTTLVMSSYSPRIGTPSHRTPSHRSAFHRSEFHRSPSHSSAVPATLSEGLQMFPANLRQTGDSRSTESSQIFNAAVYWNDHTDGRFAIETDQIHGLIPRPNANSELANRKLANSELANSELAKPWNDLRSEHAARSVAP